MTPAPIWIGGPATGALCYRAWNGELHRLCANYEYRAAADLALLIGFLCDTVVAIHAGRFFDRRRNRCVADGAALTTVYSRRVFGTGRAP